MDFGPLIVLGGVFLVCGVLCFQKGKNVFGWLSVAGVVPFLAFLGVFGVVGAIRYAKPKSAWARKNYSPAQMAISHRRFPGVESAMTGVGGQPAEAPSGADESDVIFRFLEKAGRDRVIDLQTRLRLLDYLERGNSAVEEPVAQAAPLESPPPPPLVAEPELVPPRPPEPPLVASPTPPSLPSLAPSKPAEPSRVGIFMNQTWEAVASDMALHGFAYLGVVLTFVGILGFLLFAFADIPDAAQPFVELFIALVFFGWAWMLRRQEAKRVANGMELIGGMVVPLILFAGLVDNAPFPPDFTGAALVVAMTVSSLVIAGIYYWVSARNPDSTLRFLVAPLIWLAAMTLGFAFKRDESLTSDAITRLVSPQPALASAAISLTLIAALLRRSHRLSGPTVRSALVGVPVAYLLTISLAVGEGWTLVWPIVALGLATLVSAEVLANWFDRLVWMTMARPVLIAGALGPLTPTLGIGWSGLVFVTAYLGLYEYDRRRQASFTPAAWLTMAGLAAGLVMSLQEPVASLLSFGLVSGWAHMRRRDDQAEVFTQIFNAAAALLPIGVLWALGELFGMGNAWLMMSGLVAVTTLILRMVKIEDTFGTYWLLGAILILGLGAAVYWLDGGKGDTRSAWTLLIVAVGVAAGSRWPVGRLWLAAVAGFGALAIALVTGDVSISSQQLVWAGIGLVVVVAANLWRRGSAGHLAAIGHIVGTGAVLSLVYGGDEYLVLVAWAAGWIASAAGDEKDGETLSALGNRVGGTAAGWLVPVMLVLSIPPSLVTAANQWPEFQTHRSWTGALMASLGLIYVMGSRAASLRHQLRRTLTIGAVAASIIGVSVTAPDPWPTIYAAIALIGVAALLSRDFRQAWFVWFAWLMTVVVALMLADQAGISGDSLHLVSLVWGTAMLVGGLVIDDVRSGRRERGVGLRTPWLRYPVLLGALVLPVSLGPTFVDGPDVYGWWAIGGAVAYFAVAWLLRVGSVTAPAYALTALGLTALSPRSLTEDPWLFIFLAAPMVGSAWFAEWRQSDSNTGWLRWDLAPLIVAHAVAVVAIVFATAEDGFALTAFTFGLLSVLVGLWRRQRAWEEAGNLMILLGAWDLGPGWLTIALAATAVRGAVGAFLTRGGSRISYHAIATLSAGLAWLSGLVWSEADQLISANASVLVFSGLAITIASLNRWWTVRPDTTAWLGGLAALGVVASTVYTLRPQGPGIEGQWFAVGLVLFAAALEIGGEGYEQRLFRLISVATVGLAWLAMLVGLGWTAPEAYDYTAVVFGGLALAASVVGRAGLVRPANAIRWGALGVTGVVLAALFGRDPAGGVLFDGPELAIGVAMTALAMEIGSSFTDRFVRYLAIPAVAIAWGSLALGMGWTTEVTAIWTSILFGLLVLGVGEGVRARRDVQDLNLARGWAGLGAAGVVVAAILSYDAGNIEATGYWIAASLALLAVAATRGAAPFGLGALRDVAGLAALASVIMFAYTAGRSDTWIATATLVVAVTSTLMSLAVWGRQRWSLWLRPLVVLGTVSNAIAAAVALGQLPNQSLLIGVLLSVGAQVIAVGFTRSLPGLLAIGPPVLGIAFVLSVSESVGGSAQWYTAPLGIVVLTEVEIFRTMPRFSDPTGDRSFVVLVEWIGLGILAAPPLVEMFTLSLFAGLLSLAVAAAVFVWGVATRVRRRVVAAASLSVATLVLMLFAAAAGSAPDSAFFWILAVGIGFAVMLVAGLVEAYRSKKGKTMARLDQLMVGWE